VTGSGPEGAIAGAFTFVKAGIHYYINGNYVAGGENHTLQLWLDLIPNTEGGLVCPYSFANFIGHGAMADSPV
jgi:hypothetical protein